MARMSPTQVARIEQHAVQAWPAPVRERTGGWLLRHTPGVTRLRASGAALPLAPADRLRSSLHRVEAFYADHDAPAAVQVTPAAQHLELDRLLAARGYRCQAPIQVMTAPAETACRATGPGTSWQAGLSVRATGAWLTAFAEFDGSDDSTDIAEQVVARISLPSRYVSVTVDDQIVGVGLVVGGDDRWAGVYCMATHPGRRGQGVGRAVLRAAAHWAIDHGVPGLYLQVARANVAARRMYTGVGFLPGYDYHYRVAEHAVRQAS